ncbi:MAG: HNH endonuclease [Synechococcaceae bacterium WB9_4xC_028]|nr:HNH endonuclease [Synechococcaceae bacterium WB9_4xB_025]NDD68804.1 HNH endonuclease [Synechococcaceae bacterium WB9_4xC_028]
MDCFIDGSILVPRRRAKREFRQSILEAWEHRCAYCDRPATTLDHVRPRSKGGETTRQNLISCCASCNSRKGSYDWVTWYRTQPFWEAEREGTIWIWLHQNINTAAS